MKAILLLYWQICRLRSGPEQVPSASSLLFLTLLLYSLLVVLVRILIAEMPLQYTLISLLTLTTFWALVVSALLAFKGYQNRFQQTFSASLGADLLLTLISLPLVIVAVSAPEKSSLMQVAAVGWIFFFVWDVIVKGFIFQRALQVSSLLGNLLALVLNMVILQLDQSLLARFAPEILRGS